jgi:hypothetical protein
VGSLNQSGTSRTSGTSSKGHFAGNFSLDVVYLKVSRRFKRIRIPHKGDFNIGPFVKSLSNSDIFLIQ